MSLVLILKVTHHLIFINTDAHGTDIRTLQDLFGSGILISGMSCLGGSGSNSSGDGHTHVPWRSATAPISLVMLLGFGAHSSNLGGHMAAV